MQLLLGLERFPEDGATGLPQARAAKSLEGEVRGVKNLPGHFQQVSSCGGSYLLEQSRLSRTLRPVSQVPASSLSFDQAMSWDSIPFLHNWCNDSNEIHFTTGRQMVSISRKSIDGSASAYARSPSLKICDKVTDEPAPWLSKISMQHDSRRRGARSTRTLAYNGRTLTEGANSAGILFHRIGADSCDSS